MTSLRHGLALAVAAAFGALAVSSCASIVGVDGYQDAAEVLCQCNELSFDGDCTRNVQRALDAADADVAQKWLGTFDKKNCGDSCANALTCYNQAPVCRAKGKSCSKSTQCCGYVGGKGGCCSPAPGEPNECCATCQTCAEVFAAGEAAPGVPYCSESDELIASVLQCISDNTTQCCGPGNPCGIGCGNPLNRDACTQCFLSRCPQSVQACQADVRP